MSEEFAERLRQLAEASGKSLRELQQLVHVSRSSLSRYFSGRSAPPWSVVVALCKVVGADPRHLRPSWERASGEHRRATARQPAGPAGSAGSAGSVVSLEPAAPRNDLPLDTSTFVGRDRELAIITAAARTSTILAIDGMPGVGKTSLAVHAAHALTGEFPDGQFYLDLHGFTPGRERTEPVEALRVLLSTLGVPATRVPDDPEERAALWRAELARRRAIVLLDNAFDPEQLRPLMPGTGASFVLITSRRRLVELDNVQPLSLDVLAPSDASALFAAVVGDAQRADTPAMPELLRRCGYLPLALRIAGARLRHRPAWTVDNLMSRLETDDLGVGTVFSMSLRQLDPAQRRMFGLLGLFPGTQIDPYGGAALVGVPPAEASALLNGLMDTHLLQEAAPRRYRQHDLLREYARATARAELVSQDTRAALNRLLDLYLFTASKAVDLLYPESSELRPAIPTPETPTVEFDDAAAAAEWLDLERENLMMVGAVAAEQGWPEHTIRLARTLDRHLDARARHTDALVLHTDALRAARGLHPRAEAAASIDLAWVCWRLGRYDRAHEHSTHALGIYHDLGDRAGESQARYCLGSVCWRRRDYDLARDHYLRAWQICRDLGDQLGEAGGLTNLGIVEERLAAFEAARDHHKRALTLYRSLRYGRGEAYVLTNLGVVHTRQGDFDKAELCLDEARELYRMLDYPRGEAEASNAIGGLAHAMGDPAAALRHHEAALAIARRLDNPPEQARAHQGMATAYRDLGELDNAREHAEHAVELYTVFAVPEADDIRRMLTDLEAQPSRQ